MTIEESDFKLIPVSESNPIFFLFLLYTIQLKGKDKRLEFKNAAYGISLEAAVKKVAQYRVSCNHKNEAITLLTYMKEFKSELNSLLKLCKM